MKTVFKYAIDPHKSEIEMPLNAEIVNVDFQGDDFCMWALVDTVMPDETRNFEYFATGEQIPQEMGIDYKYIGTAHTSNGLVFHAFERLGI